ncbi:MAG: hypothetical protein NT002_12795 [candidate division Zixibacteria bacterium]|nr:hypothetical protein [candidate division Zixibacteria bacterium]
MVIYLMAPVALYMLGLSLYWAFMPFLVRKDYRAEVTRVAQEYVETRLNTEKTQTASSQDSLHVSWVNDLFRIESAVYDTLLKESLYTCFYGDTAAKEFPFRIRIPKHSWQKGVILDHDSLRSMKIKPGE